MSQPSKNGIYYKPEFDQLQAVDAWIEDDVDAKMRYLILGMHSRAYTRDPKTGYRGHFALSVFQIHKDGELRPVEQSPNTHFGPVSEELFDSDLYDAAIHKQRKLIATVGPYSGPDPDFMAKQK